MSNNVSKLIFLCLYQGFSIVCYCIWRLANDAVECLLVALICVCSVHLELNIPVADVEDDVPGVSVTDALQPAFNIR